MFDDLLFDTTVPAYWGWPYHGFIAQKSNYTFTYFVNGVERALPFAPGAMPYGRRAPLALKHPDAPPLALSAADIAAEALAGRVWSDKLWLSGTNNAIYCQTHIGKRSWIAVLPDDNAWTVQIQSGNEWPAGWTWRMVFYRYSAGPAAIGGNPSGYRYFSIKINASPDNSLFSVSGAQADYQGLQDYYTVSDVSLDGRRALVHERGEGSKVVAAIRIPSQAEFDGWGVDLTTVEGAQNITFFPVIDWVSTGVVDEIVPAWPGGNFLVKRTQNEAMFSFLFEADAATRQRIQDGTLATPEVIVDDGGNTWHYWSDLPPHDCVYTSTLTRKAHLTETGDFVLYRSDHVVSVHWELVGGGVSKLISYGDGPLVEPQRATHIKEVETVMHTVIYGDQTWFGSHTHTRSTDLYASNHQLVSGLVDDGKIKYLGYVPLASQQLFAICPYSDGAVFDYNTPSGVLVSVQINPSAIEFSSPIMHMTSRVGNYNLPASQVIPVGTYYKGRFISPFLPSSSTTWAFDPETDEILQLSAADYRYAWKV